MKSSRKWRARWLWFAGGSNAREAEAATGEGNQKISKNKCDRKKWKRMEKAARAHVARSTVKVIQKTDPHAEKRRWERKDRRRMSERVVARTVASVVCRSSSRRRRRRRDFPWLQQQHFHCSSQGATFTPSVACLPFPSTLGLVWREPFNTLLCRSSLSLAPTDETHKERERELKLQKEAVLAVLLTEWCSSEFVETGLKNGLYGP